jgi:hypothetical protein
MPHNSGLERIAATPTTTQSLAFRGRFLKSFRWNAALMSASKAFDVKNLIANAAACF